MFHNRYTISIGRLAMLVDSHDFNLVKRWKIYLPTFLLMKAYNRLMTQVSETLNKSALHEEIKNGLLKTKLFNKAYTLYPALCMLVSVTWDKKHLDMIKEITGFELKKLGDRETLIAETKRLQDKYKEYLITENSNDNVSFAHIIISTEIVLEMNISRDIKLYEFEYYLKAASDKIKQLEKNGRT